MSSESAFHYGRIDFSGKELTLIETKPIEGFPGYFIDRTGQVFSNRKQTQKMRPMKIRRTRTGLRQVQIRDADGFLHTESIAYLMACTYLPGPKRPYARHIDGNRQNNHAANIMWSEKKHFPNRSLG